MKAINDPIWKTRLQVLWIAFAALYSAVAKSHPPRELSSLLTVAAGALLVALLGNVLMETKQEKMRPVLLVAFGATVFVLPLSFREFGDPLASAFAVAFALMIGSLLVFALQDSVSHRLRYTYFVGMIMALIAGAVGFPITLLEKKALDSFHARENYYVFGIQGIAAVACFAVGLAVGQWALPSSLPHNRRQRSPSLLIASGLAAFFPTLLFIGLYWARMISVLGSPTNAIVFTALHSIGLGAIPAIFLLRWSCFEKSDLPTLKQCIWGLTLAFVTAGLTAAAMEMLRPTPTLGGGLICFCIVEAPTFLTVYASVLVGHLIAAYLALNAARSGSAAAISRKKVNRKAN
jgi:hypothetical protein